MGEKSRPLGHHRVTVCFRGDCIHHNTKYCEQCFGHNEYKRKVKNARVKRYSANTNR